MESEKGFCPEKNQRGRPSAEEKGLFLEKGFSGLEETGRGKEEGLPRY